MTNFVLVGKPDFIVVGTPWQCSLFRDSGEQVHVDAEFGHVLSLLNAGHAHVEPSDQIEFSEAANVAMRQVLDRFGFERLPDTFAELHALFDYFDRLVAYSGIGLVHPDGLSAWRGRSSILVSDRNPTFRTAAELFCRGDLPGLREHHKRADALLETGRTYLPPD